MVFILATLSTKPNRTPQHETLTTLHPRQPETQKPHGDGGDDPQPRRHRRHRRRDGRRVLHPTRIRRTDFVRSRQHLRRRARQPAHTGLVHRRADSRMEKSNRRRTRTRRADFRLTVAHRSRRPFHQTQRRAARRTQRGKN